MIDVDKLDILYSPLCRSVNRNGHSVKIEIYNGDGGNWVLEIVAECGTSTLWNDQFESDQQALDEAPSTIDEV